MKWDREWRWGVGVAEEEKEMKEVGEEAAMGELRRVTGKFQFVQCAKQEVCVLRFSYLGSSFRRLVIMITIQITIDKRFLNPLASEKIQKTRRS